MAAQKDGEATIDVREMFGAIDIYLFDQLLKNRFTPNMTVLDAGCGAGRNLVYFMRSGYEVFGTDSSPRAIEEVRALAARLAPHLSPKNFRVEAVDEMSFADYSFDACISSAVLHFAENELHFRRMMVEMWRVLKPGGIFFARLASTIGFTDRILALGQGRYRLPDGSERFLVGEETLTSTADALGGEFIEPIKSVIVANSRSMAVWCLRKKTM